MILFKKHSWFFNVPWIELTEIRLCPQPRTLSSELNRVSPRQHRLWSVVRLGFEPTDSPHTEVQRLTDLANPAAVKTEKEKEKKEKKVKVNYLQR